MLIFIFEFHHTLRIFFLIENTIFRIQLDSSDDYYSKGMSIKEVCNGGVAMAADKPRPLLQNSLMSTYDIFMKINT